MKQREPSIDILRFIGLSLLILAHTECPNTLRQIRLFDVPLMVFISGLSYGGRDIGNIGSFYWKRLKRILIPVWTFIPIFMIPRAIMQATNLLHAGLTWESFWGSFIFYGEGMGYIWIYKVFLIVMLFTPLLLWINKTVKHNLLYFLIVIVFIVAQQVLCMWWEKTPYYPIHGFMNAYGFYILGYLPLYMLGLRVRNTSRKTESLLLVLTGIVAVLCLTVYLYKDGTPIQLDTYKYPPQAYYIVYGCFMSLLLWYLRKPITKRLSNKYIILIGKNCDWIYLWHAFFVFYVTYFVKQWYLQYVIIYSLALFVCYLQKRLVSKSKSEFIKEYY